MTNTILLLIISAILSALTTICIQLYISNNKSEWIVFSVVCSIVIILVYYYLYIDSNNIALLYTSCKIISILIVLLFSVYYMEEKISTRQWIGIGFSIPTILLLT
jgi:uncharacterized membrane protein